jgi:formate hydrogenlyase subunit 3/multisubunit Na+/H+ antiporter MnhD subunit
VLSLTAWNVLRLWTSLAWRNALIEFSAHPSPTITSISSLIGILTGAMLFWGIWQNKSWTSKVLIGAATGYTVWYWSERIIWQQPRPNWLFAVIVNLVLLVFVLFCLKSLTREAYERKSQHQKTERS